MVARDDAFAIREDHIGVLDAARRRDRLLALPRLQIQRAAGQSDAKTERRGFPGLDVHGVLEAGENR